MGRGASRVDDPVVEERELVRVLVEAVDVGSVRFRGLELGQEGERALDLYGR